MSMTKKRRKIKYIISGSIITLLLVLVLPLLPYAISASADNNKQVVNPISVPNPAAELWRDVRQRDTDIIGSSQVKGVDSGVLINSGGENWRQFRMEQLVPYSAYLLGAAILLIVLFRLFRGQIEIEGGISGKRLLRFTFNQRTAHWLVAVLFIILGLTGLVLLYGRFVLIPLLGPDGFSVTATVAKTIHDFAGPLFGIALVMMLITYVKRNLFKKVDLAWFASGGGFMVHKHVGSGYFNGGEKAWFWLTILGGAVIVVTGVILDFPNFGLSRGTMELSHLLHTVSSIILVAVALGHIYMGTVGVEGAYEAMATGYCDANWAKEHHDHWYQDMISGKDPHAEEEAETQPQREQPTAPG